MLAPGRGIAGGEHIANGRFGVLAVVENAIADQSCTGCCRSFWWVLSSCSSA
jgi:hypothetical protein